MNWRVAKSLLTLRDQINAHAPQRSKANDGTIGDEHHATRASDHNPWVKVGGMGIVTAIDITHDPRRGCDSYALAEMLRKSKDPRIKYIISNRKICSSSQSAWTWRPYRGSNPHDCHVHVSVKADQQHFDSIKPWSLGEFTPDESKPAVVEHPRLRVGSIGDDVKTAQQLLAIPVTGAFDARTKLAVIAFQERHNLHRDGVIGPYTWAALEKNQTNRLLTSPRGLLT